MRNLIKFSYIFAFGLALFYCSNAEAAALNSRILNNVTDQFHNQTASWGGVISGYATTLFWAFGTISLVWTGAMLILRKSDIGEFFAEFVRFIMFFGFFLWLLRNAAAIGTAIINSMIQIGAKASHTNVTNPSSIMDIGFDIFQKVMDQTSIWSPAESVIGATLAGIVLISLALIAANMTIMLCSAWMLLYAGIFFLGFGGSRWTSDIAINYYKTVLGIAVSLMSMVLMVGIAQSIINDYYSHMGAGVNVGELATIMIVAIILLLLVNRVPGLISGVLTGTSHHSSGIAAFGAGAAVGASTVALAAAATSGSMASAGARNIGGTGQALKAAYLTAQSKPNNENLGGLASVMGNTKSVVTEIGKGAGKAVKQSIGNAVSDFNEASSKTFPGRAAQAIKESSMPNSIGKGKPTSEAEEIAAFVNKKS